MRRAEAERIEDRDDLALRHLANGSALPSESSTPRARASSAAEAGASRPTPEAALDHDDVARHPIGDALALGACPLRRAPREVIPAEARLLGIGEASVRKPDASVGFGVQSILVVEACILDGVRCVRDVRACIGFRDQDVRLAQACILDALQCVCFVV